MRDEIISAIRKITGEKKVQVEVPEIEEYGDYSSNIAMQLFSQFPISNFQFPIKDIKSPRDLAEKIKKKLEKDKRLSQLVIKIEVAGPGFINFWISGQNLAANMLASLKYGKKYGFSTILRGKKYLLEHTSPNTIKTLHLGHVRNNVLGMAVHNLLEFVGAEVKMDAINNDRGIHVMKAVWAYMKYGKGEGPGKEKPDRFVDKFYIKGAKAAEDEKIKDEMQELLKKWEAGDEEVRTVWKKLRDWTLDGFKETYKKLGSKHDHQWFESDFFEKGKEMVKIGLKKKVFKKLKDGAVLTDLKKYKLADTIVLRADGTSMYHTQDLYLTILKRKKFPSDLYIWDIGPEQSLYLKQLYTMCEQLGIGKVSDYMHLSYGHVFLKGKGKMSSRKGNVISADWLIKEVEKKVKRVVEKSETGSKLSEKEKRKISEIVGLGAIKYGFLKPSRLTDLQFDIDESVKLEGDSGPYLQYTYARIKSVLRKSMGDKKPDPKPVRKYGVEQKITIKVKESPRPAKPETLYNEEELALLRKLIHFPEVVEQAAENYAPNLICNYLFDLAGKFNTFYNKHKILGNKFRLILAGATGQILENGLNLLGIGSPDRM